jgi:S-formylglutathione hydrolase FrmB
MMHPMRGALVLACLAGLAGAAGCPSQPTRTATRTESPKVMPPSGPPSASRVETVSFASDALGVRKDYVIYLPAGYDSEPGTRWPVFYYLHGLTGDETNWTLGGDMQGAADKLALRAIVVMPDGDDGFYADAVGPDYDYDACMKDGTGLFVPDADKAKTCVVHRKYETYIIHDLIDHIDHTYRTLATRDGRAIAGLSMGGLGAFELGLRHKDLFAAVASHSGFLAILYVGPHPYVAGKVELLADATQWGAALGPIGTWIRGIYGPDVANWRAHDPAALVQAVKPGEIALYLDCGTEDGFLFYDHAKYIHDLLTANKVDHAFFLGPGRHDFEFWKPRLPESLAFLAAHVAPPTAAPAR